MDVRKVKINKIHLWKNNPRKNDKAVKPLSEIIQEFGQRSPIVVWKDNMTVYKGNTTLKAMKLLGEKYVQVLYADFDNESQATAYGLADNKSSEFAEWDNDILKGIMKAKSFKGYKDKAGFSAKEVNLFMNSTDMSDMDLPDVDLVGTVKGTSDYLVIKFKNKKQLTRFQKRINNTKREFSYTDLLEKMEWKDV